MSDELVSPILLRKGGQLTVIDLWFSLLLLSFCFSFVGFLFLGFLFVCVVVLKLVLLMNCLLKFI